MIEEPLNHLFQFLRTSFRAVGEAHRTNPRRHASSPVRMAWIQGRKEQKARGRLADISRAGAALITSGQPPLHAQVRMRLVGPESTPWIEAEVLGVECESPTRRRVRVKFNEPCPTYFLRVAVLGPIEPGEKAEVDAVPEGSDMEETVDFALQPMSAPRQDREFDRV
jgi:hypothetical protein